MSEKIKVGKINRVLNSSEVHFNGGGEYCFDYYCGENLNSILRKVCQKISEQQTPVSIATVTFLNGILQIKMSDNTLYNVNFDSRYYTKTEIDNFLSNLNISAINNTGIIVSGGNNIGSIYNTTIDDGVNSVAVGGATPLPASTWKTKNLVEVLDTILFPDQYPTYTIPSISFSSFITGLLEVGRTFSNSLDIIASKNDAGEFQKLEILKNNSVIYSNTSLSGTAIANIPSQFGYTDPNNPNFSYADTYSDTLTIVYGNTTYYGRGSYLAGLPKKNNKGVTDNRPFAVRNVNAPQSADLAFNSSTITLTGAYPFFYFKSATLMSADDVVTHIQNGLANKVLVYNNPASVTITFNANTEYLYYAEPSTYTQKVKWAGSNNVSNTGPIANGSLLNLPISKTINSPDSYWSTTYRIYTGGYKTSTYDGGNPYNIILSNT
jgi:hypothetical protein